MYQVVKRDGAIVEFNISKISAAITKAFEALEKEYHSSVIDLISLRVASDFESKVKDGKITPHQETGHHKASQAGSVSIHQEISRNICKPLLYHRSYRHE